MKYLLFILICFVLNSVQAQKITYGNPSEVRMDSLYIHTKVDSILKDAIRQKAFPGVQVLAVKNHKIIFHKAYGFHTYDSIKNVSLTDVYDIASVTKILGPLPALMKLHDQKKLILDQPFSKYWKSWRCKKDKKKVTFREVLAHQAGLVPYIVFLNEVFDSQKNKKKKKFIRSNFSNKFSKQFYDSIFINRRFQKRVFRKIKRSSVSQNKVYKYSGLSFLVYPKMIENLTKTDYRSYLESNFYKPLGLNTLGYLPLQSTNRNYKIVPTELDTVFRKTLVKGWVHDENAALLGGVSGNAGLFSNAIDLAKFMQLYCNYGIYDGKRYISEQTLKEFTKVQYPENNNRRGLGFDKPLLGNDTLSIKKCYPAPEVSRASFGHSGFTGSFVWADPKYDFVFIFLSNRVYPSRKHRNIYNLNIRPKVQQVFYKAMMK